MTPSAPSPQRPVLSPSPQLLGAPLADSTGSTNTAATSPLSQPAFEAALSSVQPKFSLPLPAVPVRGLVTPPNSSDSDAGPRKTPLAPAAGSHIAPPTDAPSRQLQHPQQDGSLPTVECRVRARIPTTTGAEIFLHLYHNSTDNKEHLAVVFGSSIRSSSLDRVIPGESETDRMIRGAYTGRLYPGRTQSTLPSQDPPIPDSASSPSFSTPPSTAPLVRIHSECFTGETVGSVRCDCGEQLDEAARQMAAETSGVIVYLRQEGRGIGLLEKLKAYNLQDLGHDTYEANVLLEHPPDARQYGPATAILLDLGLGGDAGIRLLTNNPDKVEAVEGPGREVKVRKRVPMVPLAWQTGGQTGVRGEEVDRYLATKIEKFKHMLTR